VIPFSKAVLHAWAIESLGCWDEYRRSNVEILATVEVNVDELAFHSLDLVQRSRESGVFLPRKCLANEEVIAQGSFEEIELTLWKNRVFEWKEARFPRSQG